MSEYHIFVFATVARLVVDTAILLFLWFQRAAIYKVLAGFGGVLCRAGAGAWSPVFIDGVLWVSLAILTFMSTALSSEEAYKYVHPTVLFWVKFAVGSIAAGCTALKAYRSTSYSDSRKPNGVLTNPPSQPTIPPMQPTAPVTTAPADAGAQPTKQP